jgi:Starch-binding associating with outer membrane
MKKIIYNRSAILLTGLALMLSSCEKNFDTYNDDPNNPREVPNSYLLTGAQRGIMDNSVDVWWGANMGNQLAQYWSSNQYSSESRYQFRTAITNAYWGLFYSGGLNDPGDGLFVGGINELNTIIQKCQSDPAGSSASGFPANQIAVATILRVWTYQNMTDAWGDIPYTQALKPDEFRAPKYDSQESIYAGLLSELDNAISLINTGEDGPENDLIYGGDMELWKKFGNSLKMRVALRMADKNNTVSQAAFEAAVLSGCFTSNADNALFPYGSGTDANPIYGNYFIDNRNDYAASNILMDILLAQNDPRLPAWFLPATATGNYVGEVYGLSEGNAAATPNSQISQRSDLTLSAELPGIYLDYAQVEFMLAEAVERGWGVGLTAQEHYNNGVTASIDFWTSLNGAQAPADSITAYLAQPSVDYTNPASGTTYKEKIGKQKWLALFNQGTQGWTEWRRLDFGILQLPADGVLDGSGIPFRIKYPVDEQTLNSGNYNAAIANQGPDLQETKVWWDKP